MKLFENNPKNTNINTINNINSNHNNFENNDNDNDNDNDNENNNNDNNIDSLYLDKDTLSHIEITPEPNPHILQTSHTQHTTFTHKITNHIAAGQKKSLEKYVKDQLTMRFQFC